jgi:hypothetical protein
MHVGNNINNWSAHSDVPLLLNKYAQSLMMGDLLIPVESTNMKYTAIL